MSKYKIIIREIFSKAVEVDAESFEDAVEIVKEGMDEGAYPIDYMNDFEDYEIYDGTEEDL